MHPHFLRPARLIAATLLLASTLPAPAALRDGEAAPLFKAPASLAGKAFDYSLAEALRKGPVVVYFYPAAYTAGCNVQAHAFAERITQFQGAGASVVGVSLDRIERLNEFSADPLYCAGKLPVASDTDGRIAKAYDVSVSEGPAGRTDTHGRPIDHGRAERTTFIVVPDGKGGGKVAAALGGVAPDAHVEQALQTVRRLAAGGQR